MASGLAKAAAWERVPGPEGSGDGLVLRATSGDELLRFGLDDVAALEGSTWTLDSYTVGGEQRAASSQQSALLRFLPERSSAVRRRSQGQVTGSSGCNGIVGSYARDADVLSFGRLQVTDAPCTPELASQEAAMTGVLDATALILDLGYDRLTLTAPETGDSLAFVSARPLEGSTWMLRGDDGIDAGGVRVTLRLADGVASGDGPCGAYIATYVTDGVFITFRDVQGARDEACASGAAEKAMLEALRAAARVERDGERLRLRDVRGQVVLAFELPGVG
jgi:heat shock protein HslJ